MKTTYKNIEEYPLGDEDIRKILGNNINIIPYPDLEKYNDVDEIFDNENRVIILFLTTDEYTGHWLCLHKDKHDNIYYFDPYGTGIDKNKKWLSQTKLEELNQCKVSLLRLLKNTANNGVYYNTYDFQEDKKGINTCGRHCCVRLLYKHLDLDDYYDMIKKSKLTPDEFVSNITFNIIKK